MWPNLKLIAIAGLFFAGFAGGLYLENLRCSSKIAAIEKATVDAQMEADEKQRKEAVKNQQLQKQIDHQRRKINTETINENDPSYGCIVNDDGMRLLTTVKNDAIPPSEPD